LATLGEVTGRIAIGSGLAIAGFTLLIPIAQALSVWQYWIGQGALPIGDRDWDALRIQQGRPASDQELTEDYNPLEAGLWRAISFTKGCYIGQETIARLNTYQGVKQRLWGLKLDKAAPRDTILTLAGDKVGIVTSCCETEQGIFGLGYIKTKAGGAGLTLQAGDASAEAIAAPFLSHDYFQPKAVSG
jgi:folate-binding protein YgfZ